jgi:RhtB (resistance to homoserine/threonine) family protein
MFDLLPNASALVPFLVAALALNLTPGADMTYTIARTVAQGRAAGYASAAGIATGSAVHTLLAVVGLAALIQASPAAFQAIKYLGAAYLLYLAVKLLTARPAEDGAELPRSSLWGAFRQAVLVNLLNPKVALFFLAFLPQFVDPTHGAVWAQMLVLGTLFNLGGFLVNSGVTTLVAAGARRVRHSRRFQRAMNLISGTLLGGLAVRIALTER